MIINTIGSGGGGEALTTAEIEAAVDAAFPAPSEYTVTVSLTNPSSAGEFSRCTIYSAQNNEPLFGLELIGTITDAWGSIEVLVPDDSYGIAVYPQGASSIYVPTSYISTTGGVSYYNSVYVPESPINGDTLQFFEVASDGTVTLDRINYDF